MKQLEILKRIQSLPFPVFTIKEVLRLIPETKSNAYKYISRMKKAGLIYEVEKGKYSASSDPFQIATSIIQPSYISFLSGMNMRGMSDQIPAKLQVVCTRQKKSIVFQGMEIQFIHFQKHRVFGYEKTKRGGLEIFVAEPEKLIVDSLYMPQYAPVSEVFKALQGGLDEPKLLKYADLMDSKIVLKRLGYLLDLLGSDYSHELRISKKIELLNPSKKSKGELNRKWKLLVNEVLENAQ